MPWHEAQRQPPWSSRQQGIHSRYAAAEVMKRIEEAKRGVERIA